MTDIVGGEMSDNSGLSDIGLRDRIATALRTADRRVAGFEVQPSRDADDETD
jgi:hypothetical protein